MMTSQEFLQIDLPAMTAAVLACVSCALVGNFLVLRRQSMLGDAISHAILPGIVVGFLVTGTRAGLPVILGALAAAIVAGVLIEAVRPLGRLDGGAAMGVVFTGMFAGGVVLGAVTLLCVVCVTLFYKELALTSFDPNLATTLGYPAGLFHYGVVVLVAVAAIASFEAVGSILVVAMLICPPATARLLTDRLPVQLWLSVVIGGVTGAGGYLLGAFGPSILAGGPADALNAAGMIATPAGGLLGGGGGFSPPPRG